MEESKRTNSEEVEAKENPAAENEEKLTEEELEKASGGVGYESHVLGKKSAEM